MPAETKHPRPESCTGTVHSSSHRHHEQYKTSSCTRIKRTPVHKTWVPAYCMGAIGKACGGVQGVGLCLCAGTAQEQQGEPTAEGAGVPVPAALCAQPRGQSTHHARRSSAAEAASGPSLDPSGQTQHALGPMIMHALALLHLVHKWPGTCLSLEAAGVTVSVKCDAQLAVQCSAACQWHTTPQVQTTLSCNKPLILSNCAFGADRCQQYGSTCFHWCACLANDLCTAAVYMTRHILLILLRAVII